MKTLSKKSFNARFWIELLAVITGIACVLAIFLATIGAAASGGAADPAEMKPVNAQPVSPQSVNPQPVSSQPVNAQAESTVAGEGQRYQGVVTDTRCHAKHAAAIAETAADCTRMCVHGGEHFALVDGDKVYVLEGAPELLKRAAGTRVSVTGTLNGDVISVTSVRPPS